MLLLNHYISTIAAPGNLLADWLDVTAPSLGDAVGEPRSGGATRMGDEFMNGYNRNPRFHRGHDLSLLICIKELLLLMLLRVH